MSDHSELKKAALRVVEIESSEGESISDAWEDFESAANPAAVLALINEAEGLHAQHGRDSAELRSLCQARDDARKERDQLKAKIEALRKDAERYRFISQLAWYVDKAAHIYDIGNAKSPWASEREPVDADDVEAAIDAVMGGGAKP